MTPFQKANQTTGWILKVRSELPFWCRVKQDYKGLFHAFFSTTNWLMCLTNWWGGLLEILLGFRRLFGLLVLIPLLVPVMPLLALADQRKAKKKYAQWLNQK